MPTAGLTPEQLRELFDHIRDLASAYPTPREPAAMTAEEEQDWAIGIIRQYPGDFDRICEELQKRDRLWALDRYLVTERYRHVPGVNEALRFGDDPLVSAVAAVGIAKRYVDAHVSQEEEYTSSWKFLGETLEWLWEREAG